MAMTGLVKDELSRVEVLKPCCRKAEVSTLLRFAGGLHIAGGQRGNQHRCLADENRVGDDAVLDKEAMILGDPERRHTGIHRRMTDDDLASRRRSLEFNTTREFHDCCNEQYDQSLHQPHPVRTI